MTAIRLKNKHNGFTMLPDRFIDEYMPLASGEYVKIYLYLLRQANLSEPHVSVEEIAEHLMHTEKDVIRALKYWEKQGLLVASFSENKECDSIELLFPEAGSSGSGSKIDFSGSKPAAVSETVPANFRQQKETRAGSTPERFFGSAEGNANPSGYAHATAKAAAISEDFMQKPAMVPDDSVQKPAAVPDDSAQKPAPLTENVAQKHDTTPASFGPQTDVRHSPAASVGSPTPPPRRTYTPQEIEEITERESLEEMIFVINSYMGRPLSQTELTSIIYFYDQLGFSIELIEYLFEYCISKNHKSIRYIEKTALNWAEDHISTPEEARQRTAGYSEDCFSVLKAFGISGRNPVESEIRFVKLWREDYHMSTELIVDACSRTMAQIHSPSFEYADGILSGWKKADVKTPEDVKKLDEAFAAKKQQSGAGRTANRQNRGQSDSGRGVPKGGNPRQTQTRFSNFEERSYSASDDADFEKLLLSRYRGQQSGV
ncbi:MAG: DnaD domain protein [Lachnospiraceae bacterium]|nr:DnaD domain protein [Lachnospiraceae bacterium]